MSEDSIASDSLSYRTDLLPPRKRLLAGLKQNGRSSPSSSSCAAVPTEDLALASMVKLEEADQISAEAEALISLQYLHCAAERVDSHHKIQTKSKRRRTSSSLTRKKAAGAKASPTSKEVKEKVKDGVAMDVVTEKEKTAVDSNMIVGNVKEDDGDVPVVALKPGSNLHSTVNQVEEVTHAGAHKPSRSSDNKGSTLNEVEEVTRAGAHKPSRSSDNKGSTVNEVEEVTHTEARKPSRNSDNKGKEDEQTVACGKSLKPIRNSSRYLYNRNKDVDQKQQEYRHNRNSKTSVLPLADEELARQLHRAMNSSPRFSRCLSLKEDKPLLSSSRKRYPGS